MSDTDDPGRAQTAEERQATQGDGVVTLAMLSLFVCVIAFIGMRVIGA
jgi:hypothetical protein